MMNIGDRVRVTDKYPYSDLHPGLEGVVVGTPHESDFYTALYHVELPMLGALPFWVTEIEPA